MIVMDSFALPVEGTETRVNAQAQAYEYMATYTESCKNVGRLENVIGWYHSHPGYGCWLSGKLSELTTLKKIDDFVSVRCAAYGSFVYLELSLFPSVPQALLPIQGLLPLRELACTEGVNTENNRKQNLEKCFLIF